ncbi:MAG: phosphoribosyl-ATP diphosphatase [Alphaproteobacteria bacterium]|nr:MAG: phosphoribosyl-ATP diphosphatase [Alphaproteobacteria bacterium]
MSESDAEVLGRLARVIESRKGGDPEASYVARLFSKGRHRIAQKVGEEAIETALAAVDGSPDEVAAESADLLFHLMVLWADMGLAPEDVFARLAEREGTSGLDEKKSRKG